MYSDNAITSILSFMAYGDLYTLVNYKDCLHPNLRMCVLMKLNWVKKHIPPALIDVIGLKTLMDVPLLEWSDDFMGTTDYIDSIEPKHMVSPIMMGIDRYNRAFIAVRTICNDSVRVDTLFQRYSNDNTTWTHGYRGKVTWVRCFRYFCQNNKLVDSTFKNHLSRLVKGKQVYAYRGNEIEEYCLC